MLSRPSLSGILHQPARAGIRAARDAENRRKLQLHPLPQAAPQAPLCGGDHGAGRPLRSESTVEELEDQARKLAVLQEENAALHQELEETRTSLQRARKINSHFMARDKRERRKIRVSEADMAAPDAEMLPEYFGWPNDVKR